MHVMSVNKEEEKTTNGNLFFGVKCAHNSTNTLQHPTSNNFQGYFRFKISVEIVLFV